MNTYTSNLTPKEQDTEVRVTSPTGGQKGKKLARFSLLPPAAMKEVAEVYGRGAEKYADRNWEQGYDWSLSLDALERHLNLFKEGATRDELGNHHLACVIFHALALITFQKYALGKDDRTKVAQAKLALPTSKRLQVSSPPKESYEDFLDRIRVMEDKSKYSQRLAAEVFSLEGIVPCGDPNCGCRLGRSYRSE